MEDLLGFVVDAGVAVSIGVIFAVVVGIVILIPSIRGREDISGLIIVWIVAGVTPGLTTFAVLHTSSPLGLVPSLLISLGVGGVLGTAADIHVRSWGKEPAKNQQPDHNADCV